MEMDCGHEPAVTEPRIARRRGAVTRLLDQREALGQVLFTSNELAEQGELSVLAVRRQLAHLGARVTRLPGRPEAFLLVAPEHRERGAPPVLWWLDAYMQLRRQPYYVGLLSAAELHGSSQQAVQVTQVLTNKVTRPMLMGRLRVEFHVKKAVELTPTAQPPGMHSPIAVSTPEATAVDLIEYSHSIGGVARAADVIAGMAPVLTVAGLRRALVPYPRHPAHHRLGYILHTLGLKESLTTEVARHLPKLRRPVPLQTHLPYTVEDVIEPWLVIDNMGLSKGTSRSTTHNPA